MTRDKFNLLVSHYELSAARKPVAYKWWVGALAALGFGYLLTVLLLSVGLTLGLVALVIFMPNAATVKLGFIFGIASAGFSWALLRGLFVRLPKPEGRRLLRNEAPALFELIDQLRGQLGAPPFHDVILGPEHNAGVVQTPRLGVFGWQRNSLLIGLPLLQGVSQEEFRAILAHEFAHLSGAHGKFGAWIYRLRQAWERVFEELARQKRGSLVLGKFLDWFWPRFNARAFVLSRLQEYQADATAAAATSPKALASGLIRTEVQGRWLNDHFWPNLLTRARDMAAPPPTLFREMGSGFVELSAHPNTSKWLAQAFNFQTNSADTHPSLKDRLAALTKLDGSLHSTALSSELAPSTDAASRLLGSQTELLLAEELSQKWAHTVAGGWKERYAETQRLSEELARHEALPGPITAETLWLRAQIVIERDGDEAARSLLEEILAMNADHAEANFSLGRLLLHKDDVKGIALLEKAMEKERRLTDAVCEVLHGYYSGSGQPERLAAVVRLYDDHAETMQKAEAERAVATPGDTYLEPDLTADEVEALQTIFRQHSEIFSVHIARKKVIHLPELPMFIVAVKVRVVWWEFRSKHDNKELIDKLVGELMLRGNWIVFMDESNLRKLAKAVCQVSNAKVFQRE